MESMGHGRMKDRRNHIVPPWLAMSLVALTINGGLWLSARNTLSQREAMPVETPATLESGETGPADASWKNDDMARGLADAPVPLPQCGANDAPRVQRLPLSSANIPVGLDQVSTQGPRLESTSLPHRALVSNPLLDWESAELEPPSNRDPTESRSETSPPDVPPDSLAIETEPPRLLELPDTGRSWNGSSSRFRPGNGS